MTMMPSSRGAVAHINGLPFFLAKAKDGAPLWQYQQVQTQEGDPTLPRRRRINDWSRGLGDSRGVYQGAVEHCEYAFLGRMGRILPSHTINSVTSFVAHSADITSIIEVTAPANRILVGGGTKVSEINPSTHTLSTSRTVSGGGVLSMCRYIDIVAIALGDSADFEYRNAAGSYAVNSISLKARAFGISGEGDLARGYTYKWSKCSDPDFYSVGGNWSADYDIGDKSRMVTQVFGHNQFDYVLKEEGLYTFVQQNSKEANQLTDLIAFASAENRAYGRWSDWIMVCTTAGLYRYISQGAARPVGAEVHELSESVLQDTYPTAFVGNGVWAYEARYNATLDKTYLCMLRRSADGDATYGSPVVTNSIIDVFTGKCRAMHISSLTGSPELYYAKGASVAYIALTRDGKPSVFQTGNTTKVYMPPSDFGSPMTMKYFRELEIVGRNFAAGRTCQAKAAMDGGSYNNVGSALAALTANYGHVYWTRGTNDSGRVMQLEVDLANDSTSTPTEVRDIIIAYEERPILVDGAVATFRCRDGDAEEGISAAYPTALATRQAIEALLDGAPVTLIDLDGNSYVCGFTAYEGEVAYERTGLPPQSDVKVQIRRLDYS